MEREWKREWKPGDVAMVRRYPTTDEHPAMLTLDGGWVCYHGIDCGTPHDARPLVVIDPEDREQVERLRDLMDKAWNEQNNDHGFIDIAQGKGQRGNALQAAIREFANSTPPKPEEPTGLGAVVEDAEGDRWVRSERWPTAPWDPCGVRDGGFDWASIAAVRVLSEGVTS